MSATTALLTPAQRARQGDTQTLAQDLADCRRDTLRTFSAFEAHLPDLRVPQSEDLNPPLWELGHIGWFQGWWITRNPAHSHGWRADPQAPRAPAARADAEALYDSRQVAHAARWSLPLPDARTTHAEVASQLAHTLDALAACPDDHPDRLYAFRLALLHEDMHHEAALYMAQALGVAIEDPRWQAPALPAPGPALHLQATRWTLGTVLDTGFAFDNECGTQSFDLPAVQMDPQVLRWQE